MPIRHVTALFQEQEASLPSLTTVPLSLLPKTIQDIAKGIGLPATMALVEHFGGIALRIPHGATKVGKEYLAALAQIIGTEEAAILAKAYGATQVYIPSCKDALMKARDKQLIAERALLAKDGLGERDIVAVLARRYRISDRYVWKIFKKPQPKEHAKAGQGSLI